LFFQQVFLVAAEGRSKKAGVQETIEASWIPAPDQVEGRLCAGMTRNVAIEDGWRTGAVTPYNLHRHALSAAGNLLVLWGGDATLSVLAFFEHTV